MKKVIIATSVAMAASAAFGAGFTTWDGATGEEQVQTGLDNGTKTAGYWWDYADGNDGGSSSVEWPVAKGNEYSAGSLQPIIENCGGVCGTFKIAKGSMEFDGFAGVGFNIAGENATNSNVSDPADASSWGGLCIVYDSDAEVMFEMGQGARDPDFAYGPPYASLPAGSGITKDLGWDAFKMPDWATTDERNKVGGEVSGAEASKTLVAVKFKVQAKDGSYAFNIKKVGPKGGCGAENSGNGGNNGGEGGNGGNNGGNGGNTAIALTGISTAKAILSGRTLSFSGIDNAKVEVVNLQGQVMLKGTASSTASMNLAGLDAGVYMVRIAGKAVNMSQKILVK